MATGAIGVPRRAATRPRLAGRRRLATGGVVRRGRRRARRGLSATAARGLVVAPRPARTARLHRAGDALALRPARAPPPRPPVARAPRRRGPRNRPGAPGRAGPPP